MKISKLQKKIGQFTLQIEELYLESGKVHGLIGTNGCGKTTLSIITKDLAIVFFSFQEYFLRGYFLHNSSGGHLYKPFLFVLTE